MFCAVTQVQSDCVQTQTTNVSVLTAAVIRG